jgi:predicted SAM-dependent methyltransferase
MSKLNYVNLGCGVHFHRDWINIDFISNSDLVISHNLLNGIPLESNSVEVVYHSHVLEHLPKEKASEFIAECFRVLKPGGIIRVAVPDLEQIIRGYIEITEILKAQCENKKAWANYDWIMLEMYDQTVRSISGGNMGRYLTSGAIINKEFILERCGEEVGNIINSPEKYPEFKGQANFSLLKELYRIIRYKGIRELIVRILLGGEYKLLQTSRFRLGGEIHLWMYDQFSLSRLLTQNSFENFLLTTAFESGIPNWPSFDLDGKNGMVRKPDSLFAEAKKPS